MEPIRIKLLGVGGQGIQFMGKLLGKAAFLADFNVTQASNYEPVTKGGLTTMDIILAERETPIDYPFIDENPHIMMVLAQKAWDRYKYLPTQKTYVFIDEEMVHIKEGDCKSDRIIAVPFSRIAREIGTETVTNMVALGYLAEKFDIGGHYLHDLLKIAKVREREEHVLLEIHPQAFEASLVKMSPKRFVDVNIRAFKKGYEIAKEDPRQFT